MTVFAIGGPTAVGKTSVAIELALRTNGEIINCDAIQIYKGLNIGSAKPIYEERKGVEHHLIDICDPSEKFDVSQFSALAIATADIVISKGKTPVFCGGSGLYIDSVLYNEYSFHNNTPIEGYREKLETILLEQGSSALHDMLRMKDPLYAEMIHPNNTKRVIRALEAIELTSSPLPQSHSWSNKTHRYDQLKYFVLYRNRENLYEAINKRTDVMIQNGLVEEVNALIERGIDPSYNSMQAIGYKEIYLFLMGQYGFEEAVEKIKQASRRYAKRQLTWFKRNSECIWIDMDQYDPKGACEFIIESSKN